MYPVTLAFNHVHDVNTTLLEGCTSGTPAPAQAAYNPPMLLGDSHHPIGASLGIAMYPDHGPNIGSLIHIADQAMYRAKRNGNNQYCLGNASSDEQPQSILR